MNADSGIRTASQLNALFQIRDHPRKSAAKISLVRPTKSLEDSAEFWYLARHFKAFALSATP